MRSSSPGVEIVWDGGGWHRSHRRYMRPFVEGAIELASDTLEEVIGINYEHPKTARIKRCGNASVLAGESSGSDEFALFVPVRDYKHRKAQSGFSRYTTSSIHEIAHTARQERYDTWDLLEEVASEGIAHVAEDLTVIALDLSDQQLYTTAVGRFKSLVPGLKSRLYNDYSNCDSEEMTEQLIDEWFDWQRPRDIDDGVVVGVTEVHQRLIEGHRIGDIIDWPPEKILDL